MSFPMLCKNTATPPKTAEMAYKTNTAWRWDRPISISLKCKCWRSPENGLLWNQSRFAITQATSKIGIPITNKAVAIFAPEIMASTPKMKPKKVLPPSPKKMVAGLKAKNK